MEMKEIHDFQYTILRSRRRTVSITINPDTGVVIKAPSSISKNTIEKFVDEKSDWIIKTLRSFDSLIRIDKAEGYKDGDTILLFGKPHRLKVVPSEKYSVKLTDDYIIEAGYHNDNNPLIIRALLETWFKNIAQNRFRSKFREIMARYKDYGFQPDDFIVRTMKKRWGSCSFRGKIAISYDLIRLDEIYSEYVILHELCHLKHHNHGSGFYKLLSEMYPDWKKVRKELKTYIR
jgi:predicted metal-dependent hydrolase